MKTGTLLLTALTLTHLSACGSEAPLPEDNPWLQGNCLERTWFADADDDGYGDANQTTVACEQPTGYVGMADDCNDQSAMASPNGVEVCDGLDNDCNGLIDADDPGVDSSTVATYYRDADGDGYGRSGDTVTGCSLPAGYAGNDADCDDWDGDVHPFSTELCDEIDNDCDGLIDFDDPSADLSGAGTYYPDNDNDGYGDDNGVPVQACSRPYGYAEVTGDCDDSSYAARPGADETCDGFDNDCDGTIDAAACTDFEGSYAGAYTILAEEKLGSTVINSMRCTGTSDLAVDFGQTPALAGTISCNYSGGLGSFDSSQSGVVEGHVAIDGTISGSVEHEFDWGLTRTFSFTGTIAGGVLQAEGTGSFYPHPQSAVAWQVELSFDGN